ncbi:MAG TPA: glycosyltransferase family 2 protein [Polyangiaceae bacterium]|jgi:hypothetical protein|nr:glycosyltransferase family 2 protein [Polyangiaceae bacterium]
MQPSTLPTTDMPRQWPTLVIVIVNYRAARLLVECLDSLEKELSDLPARVVISENDSRDGSAELLRSTIESRGWAGWVSLLEVGSNRGFSAGNNAAIAPALSTPNPPDYVLLLNPDTRVLPGAIHALLEFMQAHPRVGIVGANQVHPNGTPLRSAFRFANPLGELDGTLRLGPVSSLLRHWIHAPPIPSEPGPADWVSGGCMMVRKAVFDDVGLMDEGYFLYFEEMDFCLQAKHKGWSTWFLPSATIVHIGGQSTGVTGLHRIMQRKPEYWFDSRRRYYLKNHQPLRAMAADALNVVGLCLWEVRRIAQRREPIDPPKYLRDSIRNSVFLRGFALPGNSRDT